MDVSTLLLSVLLLVGSVLVQSDAVGTTYNLFYDGILSSRPTSASEVSSDIASHILQLLKLEGDSILMESKNVDRHCHETTVSSRCFVGYVDEAVSLDVSTHLVHDSGDLRIDVTLTSSQPREVLVQSVFKISKVLGIDEKESVWSIRHRPSVEEMKQQWSDTNAVAFAQDHRDLDAASLGTMILERSELRNRTRIATNASWEVWQYEDVGFNEPIRVLFDSGVVQTTTSPAAAAHAEALVHPAMIAHTNPESVLVVSKTPSAIVRQVLKHKSVTNISVVGADQTALELIETHMPSLTDCDFLGGSDSKCLKQEQVKMINQDAAEWISGAVQVYEQDGEDAWKDWYDVILVDVPTGTNEWLSLDLYRGMEYAIESHDAIVVLSSGSEPSLFDVDTQTQLSSRETFLRQAPRLQSHGGLEFSAVHVYDEPLAQPLSSSFFALFYDRNGSSYARFVRKNSPMIDFDIVSRLLPTETHTMVYDGPTHVRYMVPSKAWENHYCKTIPGRDLPICQSFLHDFMDESFHRNAVGVRQDPIKGRTAYATKNIPKGHFVNPQDAAFSWRIEQDQWLALNQFVKDYPDAEMYRQLRDFIVAYGFEQQSLGLYGWGVSIACTNTFVNHACNETQENVGWPKSVYQGEDGAEESVSYSPAFLRRTELLSQFTLATKDIKAGDEILQNYATFRDDPNGDIQKLLKNMCDDGVGLVRNGIGGDEL